jgi:two-component system, response regulator YesN
MDFTGEARLRTLIVENNASFRGMLREDLLNRFPSMVIQEAVEGKEALQRMEAFHPELIFMDLQLPGENGLQLTQKIKTSYPGAKVIILTGHDIPEYREAAARCGANAFISKDSLNARQLEELVKYFANSHS